MLKKIKELNGDLDLLNKYVASIIVLEASYLETPTHCPYFALNTIIPSLSSFTFIYESKNDDDHKTEEDYRKLKRKLIN